MSNWRAKELPGPGVQESRLQQHPGRTHLAVFKGWGTMSHLGSDVPLSEGGEHDLCRSPKGLAQSSGAEETELSAWMGHANQRL